MKTFLFVFISVVLFQYFYTPAPIQVGEIKHENVILYATSWCGYCKKTRAFLDSNNIEYIEYDVEKSGKGRKAYQALNAKGVPVLDIHGTIIYGYDMDNTKQVLRTLNLM